MNTPTQPKSKVQEEIDRAKDVQAYYGRQIAFLEQHREAIERIGLRPQIFGGPLDFNNPTREQVVEALKAFGGKWEKEVQDNTTITYTSVNHPSGLVLRLFSAKPPPSCHIVETEEIVPAQPERIVKARKLVCPEAAMAPAGGVS